MGEQTAIAWTDHTFNPWWGCVKVSAACDNCYAEATAKLRGHAVWGKDAPRRFLSDHYWNDPLRWNRKAEAAGVRERVFCASMADVFEPNDKVVAERHRLFRMIEATPWLDWQLLTKRPEQINRLAPERWLDDGWPPNIWLGTTVEDQDAANLRIQRLLAVHGHPAVLFLSMEPLLGSVLLGRALRCPMDTDGDGNCPAHRDGCPTIGWVIVGGESGNGSNNFRALDLDHARALRDECAAAGVPFFFKQVGGIRSAVGGDELDGQVIKQFPTGAQGPPAGRLL